MRKWSRNWVKAQVKRDFDLNISNHTAREIQTAHRNGTLMWVTPPKQQHLTAEEVRAAHITFPTATGGQARIELGVVKHNGASYSHTEWEYEEALTEWPKLSVLPAVRTGYGERVTAPVENHLFRYAKIYVNPIANSDYRYIGRVYDLGITAHSLQTTEEDTTIEKHKFRTLYEAGKWLHTKQHDTRLWRARKGDE